MANIKKLKEKPGVYTYKPKILQQKDDFVNNETEMSVKEEALIKSQEKEVKEKVIRKPRIKKISTSDIHNSNNTSFVEDVPANGVETEKENNGYRKNNTENSIKSFILKFIGKITPERILNFKIKMKNSSKMVLLAVVILLNFFQIFLNLFLHGAIKIKDGMIAEQTAAFDVCEDTVHILDNRLDVYDKRRSEYDNIVIDLREQLEKYKKNGGCLAENGDFVKNDSSVQGYKCISGEWIETATQNK